MKMHSQHGFTLIELIVVIVILGILAATALPRFVNFQGDAATSAVKGVAGAVSSASALNYSKYQLNTAQATQLNGATACNTLITSTRTGLTGAALPSGYSVQTEADCSAKTAGETADCTIRTTQGGTNYDATATIICTG